jgi:hypothetical protein
MMEETVTILRGDKAGRSAASACAIIQFATSWVRKSSYPPLCAVAGRPAR